MKHRNNIRLITGILGLIVLIFDGSTAITGMRRGMELCLYTLIPTLFPFCVLSMMITCITVGRRIRILEPIGRLFGIPKGTESLLLVGWLGGYPVGAQNAAAAYRQGCLSRTDAQRLAVICNNAGPSFLFGVLGPIIGDRKSLWILWGIQILGSLLTARMIPSDKSENQSVPGVKYPSFPEILRNASGSMVNICSCVIFFRMILEFLNRWILWILPETVQILVSGFLELSNGCILLASADQCWVRFIMASALLSFGGICVWMQTMSVCSSLGIRNYLFWKSIQAIVCSCLAYACLHFSRMASGITCMPLIIVFLTYILALILKKGIAFSDAVLYNKKSAT